MINHPLSGIMAPMVTPLTPDKEVDLPSIGRLVEHLVAGGVNSIFVLGSTGEGPLLPIDAQQAVADAAVEAARGRVPVLAGISDVSTEKSLRNLETLGDLDLSGFVSMLPLMFCEKPREQLRHFVTLADAAPAPLLVYEIPQRTHQSIHESVILEISRHPNVWGLKYTNPDLVQLRRWSAMVGTRENFVILLGNSRAIAQAYADGFDGSVPNDANAFPELCSAIHLAAGFDHGRAAEAQLALDAAVADMMARYPNPSSVAAKSYKMFLREKGILASDALAIYE